MRTRKLKTGEKGWLGLVAYIIAVDSLAWKNQANGQADETMSVSWARWLQFPKSRTATGVAWALITAHLFLAIPLPGRNALRKIVVKGTERNQNGDILVVQIIQTDS